MRKQILWSAPLALLLLSGCVAEPTDLATPQKTTADGTKIFRSDTGKLTPPSVEAPALVAESFLLHHGLVANAGELSATAYKSGNVTHVRMTQTIDGLRVHGAYAKVAVSDKGEILQVIERLAMNDGELEPTAVTEREALSAAMLNLGYAESPGDANAKGNFTFFAPTKELYRAPSVEKVAYVGEDGAPYAGFVVETWSSDNNQLDYTLVDGDGKVLSVENRTANDSYKVFTVDPSKTPQAVVNGPGAGNAQSPAGWVNAGNQSTWNIVGNNVKAYLDTDANNAADSGGTTVSDGNFLATADLAQQPSTTTNKSVAVQNLFYLNNVIHDILYTHGFTEANGNFQTNNFGKGGNGNDPVNAEAQDGSGTDNANFSTPTDGSSPRMQMYLWSGTTPTGLTTVNGVDYGTYASSFGPALTLAGTTGNLAVYNDNTGVTSDACEAAPAGSLTGKIAIVDRGTCNFTVKVLNAQTAGAVGVVIVNNVAGAFGPGGTERKIKIPSGMVTPGDGATLKGLAGASAKLRKNPVAPIMLDGDVDSGIVYHEYGHGLTWRMIGSMSGKLAGALGEGASDVTAFLINNDPIMGAYAYGNPAGIRRYSYEGYPLTYKNVTGAEVHDDGEIYAGAMWRVYQNYLAAGFTASQCMDDFVHGMDFTPAAPAYEDMRDGMLQATAGTGRECLIWRGFAASGIGVGADGLIKPSGALVITESFTVPANCQ